MTSSFVQAPGKPGISPRWTTSSKIGVGTSATGDSNVWFTISHGILNEVYYPRVDIANIRDMQFLVTDGKDFFSEEKRDANHEYSLLADGVPAYHLVNTCLNGRYQIEKKIIADPDRNVVMQEVQFIPLVGSLKDYHLYALIAPHIANAGSDNNGWADKYKGVPMLFAQRQGICLAMACSVPYLNMTCGYVGASDGWHELQENKRLVNLYQRASGGNIALTAEIDLEKSQGRFVIAISFAHISEKAGIQARASLFRDFDYVLDEYISGWRGIQEKFKDLGKFDPEGGSIFKTSTAVLKIHEGKQFSGSVIASLSIPWGFSKGDNDLGGYHLIWPRDQVQTAQALLASGDDESARQALLFLMCSQESNGHWAQCMWEDGTAYWKALQMDETAIPILLADHLRRGEYLKGIHPWEMVAKAASFLVQNGPVTEQDRWEENGGYTPFTIATEISGLLAAADFFEERGKGDQANYLREVADWWNESIERWLYVTDTPLAKEYGVDGYYVRIYPGDTFVDRNPTQKNVLIKNRPMGESLYSYTDIVSVDILALVRYGLRKADDPRILNTIKIIDALLKTETTKGAIWHRYNEDGYGEHEDGSPYDGTGIGRGWPLLSGERAHYEIVMGNRDKALNLLRCMARFAGVGGMIPEQIWDTTDIPKKNLYNGHSSGSAKPLVWAHAEYISLLRSVIDNKVFNMPPQTHQRYIEQNVKAKYAFWRMNHRLIEMPKGKVLRIQLNLPARVRWTIDDWKTYQDDETADSCLSMNPELNIFYLDLPTQDLLPGQKAIFTFYWYLSQRWEGKDFEAVVTL